MKILLIDADSKIPNIPLMRLSTYYKKKGADVILRKCNLPYFPTRKKLIYKIKTSAFDKTYCSVVFAGNKRCIKGDGIIYGGTGVDLKNTLPDKIEKCELDYSIYPGNDTSYGFISRGCIRKCDFCFVPEKEGYIRQVSTVDNIVKHDKVKFLDNNFLALPNHKEIIQELIDKNICCQFNQGLDIRLIDAENSALLSKMRYLGKYLFAFDNYKFKNIITEKLKIMKWIKPTMLRFFVYVNPRMPLSDTVRRLEFIKKIKQLAYMMRDISCWKSPFSLFYSDLNNYCNFAPFFCSSTFYDYMLRIGSPHRIIEHRRLYYDNT